MPIYIAIVQEDSKTNVELVHQCTGNSTATYGRLKSESKEGRKERNEGNKKLKLIFVSPHSNLLDAKNLGQQGLHPLRMRRSNMAGENGHNRLALATYLELVFASLQGATRRQTRTGTCELFVWHPPRTPDK